MCDDAEELVDSSKRDTPVEYEARLMAVRIFAKEASRKGIEYRQRCRELALEIRGAKWYQPGTFGRDSGMRPHISLTNDARVGGLRRVGPEQGVSASSTRHQTACFHSTYKRVRVREERESERDSERE